MTIGRSLLSCDDEHTPNTYLSEAKCHDPALAHPGAPCSVVINRNLLEDFNSTHERSSSTTFATLSESSNGLRGSGVEESGASRDLVAQETESQNENGDRDRIASVHKKIEKGLVTLDNTKAHALGLAPKLPAKSYESYATELFQLASKAKKDTRASIWWLRFLAGCILLSSPSLPARSYSGNAEASSKISKRTLDRWKVIA